MKRYIVFIGAIIAVLALTLGVYAAGGRGRGAGGGMGMGGMGMGGRGGQRGGMRGGGLNVESVNAAIAAIEKQIEVLKKAMEGAEAGMGRGARGERGDVDFQAAMEQMQKRNEIVQAAAADIADQVLVLKGNQAQTEFQEEITELQSIAASARQEEAEKTTELVQAMIEARQEEINEPAERVGIQIRIRGGRGGRGGGGGFGSRGGDFTPPPGGFQYED